MPLLNKDRSRNWVIDAISQMRINLDVSILAYVIMPEHVHLLVYPNNDHYEIRRILAALKSPVSRNAKKYLVENCETGWLNCLTTYHGAREVFRFWQPGGGFDENLFESKSIENVIDYIHANPVRRELVSHPSDWKWSSARHYFGEENSVLQVDKIDFS
ncbi:Transposase IS200 like protein [Rubinisphaera italica]|uniref:Transposase IS200 like protein n=2 Tax=Rubinisphaera italica TaxID=2527969 RepID=A0A5C5X8Q7_9PLAN|nr:Transposase IS200 like protein [Rubinisphaera italica]